MANVVKQTVTVDALSKYGFKSDSGYYNWSKNIPAEQMGKVVPGATFEMMIYTADSGTKYVNEVNDMVSGGKVPSPTGPTERFGVQNVKYEGRKKESAPENDKMSKEEWAAKDVRISRQGVIQAAVIALAPVVSLEQLPEQAAMLADRMLAYVNTK